MAYELSWYIDKRVLKLRVYGVNEMDEFEEINNHIQDYAQQGNPPVYLIVDVREVTQMPLNFNTMLQGMTADRWKNKIAFTWLVSDNRLINFFGVLASKVATLPVYICKTLEEANTQLAHLDPALVTLLNDPQTS
jgi:hypothetical protein